MMKETAVNNETSVAERSRSYESYKDSGVEWLGEIPEHWKVERAKWLFLKKERPVRKTDEIITCFRDGEVTLRSNRKKLGFTVALKEHGYQGIRKGDLVIHAMDAFAGAIGVSDSDGKSTPVYSVCVERFPETVNQYYYSYFLRSLALNGIILALAKGIRERSTDFRFSDFGELALSFPPLQEQTKIAQFLDDKTTKIDEAIAIKEQQIQLLKERKQILIHNAVTKGVRSLSEVEMKDSGVEWIGAIPVGWEVARIKQCSKKISKGTTPSTEGRDILQEGKVRFLKSENIFEGFITEKPLFFIDEKTNFIMKRSNLEVDDVLFVIAGASLGKVAVITEEILPANTNQAVAFIRPNKKIHPYFLSKYLVSSIINELTWLEAVQSAQPNLSMESLGNFPISLPPLSEQKEILNYIETASQKIETAISLKLQEIAKLKEYKRSLINGVVTGKVRVC